MKRIKQLSMAGIITVVLAITTFAGEIHTGVAAPPPPPPQAAYSATEPSDISGVGEILIPIAPSGLATEITLSLLQLLSVF